LKGVPVYSSGVKHELVTPTGAAMVRALECRFSPFPEMTVDTIGYGAGSRNLNGHPNVLRISVGELNAPVQAPEQQHPDLKDAECMIPLPNTREKDCEGKNNGQPVLRPSDAIAPRT
jgi:uncharacterized protein (DUF111 family)